MDHHPADNPQTMHKLLVAEVLGNCFQAAEIKEEILAARRRYDRNLEDAEVAYTLGQSALERNFPSIAMAIRGIR